jgi:hypothetical protein
MVVKLPTLAEQREREHRVFRDVEQALFKEHVAPRITEAIINEHRANPIGKHSDDLERVLIYLRKHHLEMAGKYILVCTKPHEEWRIATITGVPNEPPQLLDDTFNDRFQAEHGLFLKRLADNNLTPTKD